MGENAGKDLGDRLFLVFLAGGIEFCASLRHVEEIAFGEEGPEEAARLLSSEEGNRIFLRDRSLRVIELAAHLGLAEKQRSGGVRPRPSGSRFGAERNIIATCVQGKENIGLAVGRIMGIDDLSEKPFLAFPNLMASEGSKVFDGFYEIEERLILLLNLPRIVDEALS